MLFILTKHHKDTQHAFIPTNHAGGKAALGGYSEVEETLVKPLVGKGTPAHTRARTHTHTHKVMPSKYCPTADDAVK